MKLDRKFFFRAITVLVIIILAVVMFIIGRGHKIYFDNKVYSSASGDIPTPYKVEVYVKNNDVQKLYNRERGEAKITGQKLKVNLEITDKKGGEERSESFTLKIPYSMDGAVINLPALLSGLGPEDYLTEFVSLATTVSQQEEEAVVTDEFSIGGDL